MTTTTFIEAPRFPDYISYGSGGGPSFSTQIFESYSGIEQRQITRVNSISIYMVGYGIRDTADMNTVRDFFYNVKGRAIGFRFKDWADYQIINQNIGTGDDTTTVFKVYKDYISGSLTYTRRIYKIINDVNLIVKVNGVTQIEITDYTVDTVMGKITFAGGSIPAMGEAITISCEFDTPVRFDTDIMGLVLNTFDTESWQNINLKEILLPDV